MTPFTATLDVLAVYRLSRLIGRDTFPPIKKIRDVWLRAHPEEGDEPDGGLFWLDGEPGPELNTDGALELWIGVRGSPEVEDPPDGTGTWTNGRARLRAQRYGGKVRLLEADPLGEIVVCPWCNSPYVAVAVLAARRFAPRLWGPVAWVLAASAVTGLLTGQEG